MSRSLVLLAILVSFLAGGSIVALTDSHAAQPVTETAPTATPVNAPDTVPAPGAQPTTGAAAAIVPPARPESFADLAAALQPAVVNISTTQTLGKKSAHSDDKGELQNPDGDDQDGDDDNGGDDDDTAPQANPFPPGSPFDEFFKDFFNHQGIPFGQPGQGSGNAAPRKAMALGSGFVYEIEKTDGKDGMTSALVATNNHVIENADEIKVILSDNTKLDATLVGKDPKTDLALLRVKTPHKLTAVSWGDSDVARVGDWVLAIGNPFGLGGTVTAGIVSARARDINAGPYDDFIQTDAPINRGNSGGPMFNMKGEVIGINTAIYSPSGGSVGIGFAIPSNLAKPIVEQLKSSGNIKRGWIGVRIQNVTDDIAQSLGLQKTTGALVSSIEDKSPAAKAGIKAGDVILSFGGHEVSEMRRLPRIVAETPLNASVPMLVWRNGHETTLQIKVGELPADQTAATAGDKEDGKADKPSVQRVEQLGMKLAAITPALRQRYQLDEKAKGVLVAEVDGNADASDKGIRAGDLIVEANQAPIATPADLIAKVKDVPVGRPILLLVEHSGDARYVAVTVGKAK